MARGVLPSSEVVTDVAGPSVASAGRLRRHPQGASSRGGSDVVATGGLPMASQRESASTDAARPAAARPDPPPGPSSTGGSDDDSWYEALVAAANTAPDRGVVAQFVDSSADRLADRRTRRRAAAAARARAAAAKLLRDPTPTAEPESSRLAERFAAAQSTRTPVDETEPAPTHGQPPPPADETRPSDKTPLSDEARPVDAPSTSDDPGIPDDPRSHDDAGMSEGARPSPVAQEVARERGRHVFLAGLAAVVLVGLTVTAIVMGTRGASGTPAVLVSVASSAPLPSPSSSPVPTRTATPAPPAVPAAVGTVPDLQSTPSASPSAATTTAWVAVVEVLEEADRAEAEDRALAVTAMGFPVSVVRAEDLPTLGRAGWALVGPVRDSLAEVLASGEDRTLLPACDPRPVDVP